MIQKSPFFSSAFPVSRYPSDFCTTLQRAVCFAVCQKDAFFQLAERHQAGMSEFCMVTQDISFLASGKRRILPAGWHRWYQRNLW